MDLAGKANAVKLLHQISVVVKHMKGAKENKENWFKEEWKSREFGERIK